MPFAVKIKDGKYGAAILHLLLRGGSFQTRFERTLIVNGEQKQALEEAGFVETNESGKEKGKKRGKKA